MNVEMMAMERATGKRSGDGGMASNLTSPFRTRFSELVLTGCGVPQMRGFSKPEGAEERLDRTRPHVTTSWCGVGNGILGNGRTKECFCVERLGRGQCADASPPSRQVAK